MSENIYVVNKTKKEKVYGYGNHNRADSLRHNFPILLMWLLSNDWYGDTIICMGDTNYTDDFFELVDKTNHYINKFNDHGSAKEHGKMVKNEYAE